MRINSKCYIPNDVRADDIVEAIAYLCGATKRLEQLGGDGVCVSGERSEINTAPNGEKRGAKYVYVRPTHDMQYHEIEIAATNCDHVAHTGSLFTRPSNEYPGYYCLYAGVSDFWQKIDRALVDMFGGYIDDNDCDSSEIDYKKDKPRKSNCPSGDDEWNEYQNALYNMPVLFHFIREQE